MKIALDAMGGDHAPEEIVKGAYQAAEEFAFVDKIFLVGNQEILSKFAQSKHKKIGVESRRRMSE